MVNLPLVKDAMVPAVQLDANTTVGETLRRFDHSRVLFGVVNDKRSKPLTIFAKEHLDVAWTSSPVEVLTVNVPYPLSIEPHETLDSLIQAHASTFAVNQNFIGAVVQEQGEVMGVLLREVINQYAQSVRFPVSFQGSLVHLGIIVQEQGNIQNVLLRRIIAAYARSMQDTHSPPVAPLRSLPVDSLDYPFPVPEDLYSQLPGQYASTSVGRIAGTGRGLLYRCDTCQCNGVRRARHDPDDPPKCPADKNRKMKRVYK